MKRTQLLTAVLLVVLTPLSAPAVQKKRRAREPLSIPITEPFDLSWEVIPPTYRTDNFDSVFAASKTKPKGEFETKAEHRASVSVDTSRLYSFPVEGHSATFKYNADEGEFTLPLFGVRSKDSIRGTANPSSRFSVRYLSLREEIGGGPDTIGTNAFGAKVAISHIIAKVDGIALHVPQASTDYTDSPTESFYSGLNRRFAKAGTIKMASTEARAVKDDLALLVVVRLSTEFDGCPTLTGMSYSGATFETPIEATYNFRLLSSWGSCVVIYNKKTGKIYAKW